LAPFIHHFWVFESDQGLPAGDARVVVPNGRHKLIVPYRNALKAQRLGETQTRDHGPGDPVLIGLWEEPSIISTSVEPTASIGVEFLPHGLSRFFGLSAVELTEKIVPVADALGRAGKELAARVGSAEDVPEAVRIVEDFLLERFQSSRALPDIVPSALGLMQQAGYQMEVNDLEKRMGYSRRYLHALFVRYVGLPPKRLGGVLAFERLYRRFSNNWSAEALRRDALDIFYDQSHFIRTFKRFTGHSPGEFARLENEFGRIFYLPTR
jgi:AraC-like DNA-binding protein